MVFLPILGKDHIILRGIATVFGHCHTIDIVALCLHGQCLVTSFTHCAVSEYGGLRFITSQSHDGSRMRRQHDCRRLTTCILCMAGKANNSPKQTDCQQHQQTTKKLIHSENTIVKETIADYDLVFGLIQQAQPNK